MGDDIILTTLETEDCRYIFRFSTIFIHCCKRSANAKKRYDTFDENPDSQNRQKFREPEP